MATYKVPQDVEAEDKLLGPLSFRQFIYAGIALGAGALAFFMFQVFPLLAMIPLPVILLFGALALPLRKDQPMETYLLAILRFYLKPKLRLWNPDGTITYVEITVPKFVEQHLIKDISGQNAQDRLDYLARVMDSRGWALKGVVNPQNSMTADATAQAQSANDIMDEDANLSRSIDSLIAKKNQERKESARAQMLQAAQPAPAAPQPAAAPATRGATTRDRPSDVGVTPLHYNPYPNMHQKVVHTVAEQEQAAKQAAARSKPANPVPAQLSPDIMNLVRSDGLSISTIAREAHRLEDKEEVVINLHNG